MCNLIQWNLMGVMQYYLSRLYGIYLKNESNIQHVIKILLGMEIILSI
jgi:hypothetical protein